MPDADSKELSGCYEIKSTSPNSALVSDILLKETKTTRLIFRPQIIKNPDNPEAAIKGDFIHQRRSANDTWEDHTEFPLNTLKNSEWVKLHLNSEETLLFSRHLAELYRIYQENGVPQGNSTALITRGNRAELIKQIVANPAFLNDIMSVCNDSGVIIECLRKLRGIDLVVFGQIVDRLAQLEVENLDQINSLAGIATMQKVMEIWNENQSNSQEEFWQRTFSEYPWVLEQVFASPMVVMQDKAYVGAKSIDNTGGKIIDYLCKNKLTNNVALIEIKTPATQLVTNTVYRVGACSIHSDLSGAINQTLLYRDTMHKSYFQSVYCSKEKYDLFNPQCIIIAGTLDSISSDEAKVQSFELFRSELKNVEIITFDELFERIGLMLKLLRGE